MTQEQVLLVILGILIVANVFLVASIPYRTRRRPRSAGEQRQTGSRRDPAGRGDPPIADDAPAAAAIEAFVASVSNGSTGRTRPPPPWETTPSGRQPSAGPASAITVTPLRTTEAAAHPGSSPPELADAATWSRAIREESARAARYAHPVTVVMAELPHLDVLADRFGQGVADRVASEAARVLISEGRAADRIARLGDARFGVLLSETAELAAAGYIERVRAAIDTWLESTGLSTRLSLGWASPAEGGDVTAAAIAAEQRMHDSEHRPTPERVPARSSTKGN
ncbi:MAG TPA: diguanylate cyclase [Candidatus Limnocylindrales bacterium]|nr:diguanylate cyclase [Candidatus Limnocylindrales bacterium]